MAAGADREAGGGAKDGDEEAALRYKPANGIRFPVKLQAQAVALPGLRRRKTMASDDQSTEPERGTRNTGTSTTSPASGPSAAGKKQHPGEQLWNKHVLVPDLQGAAVALKQPLHSTDRPAALFALFAAKRFKICCCTFKGDYSTFWPKR